MDRFLFVSFNHDTEPKERNEKTELLHLISFYLTYTQTIVCLALISGFASIIEPSRNTFYACTPTLRAIEIFCSMALLHFLPFLLHVCISLRFYLFDYYQRLTETQPMSKCHCSSVALCLSWVLSEFRCDCRQSEQHVPSTKREGKQTTQWKLSSFM